MPYYDNLEDLPEFIKDKMASVTGKFLDDWGLIESILDEAKLQIDTRYDLCLLLLDMVSILEIAVNKSMVESQKEEFSWRFSLRYFNVYVSLIQHALEHDGFEKENSRMPFLISKLRYERARRLSAMKAGGYENFETVFRPVVHLL